MASSSADMWCVSAASAEGVCRHQTVRHQQDGRHGTLQITTGAGPAAAQNDVAVAAVARWRQSDDASLLRVRSIGGAVALAPNPPPKRRTRGPFYRRT